MKFTRHLKCIDTHGSLVKLSHGSQVIAGTDELHHYQHCFNTVSTINRQRIRSHTLMCTEFSIFTVLFNMNKIKMFIAVIINCCMLLQALCM